MSSRRSSSDNTNLNPDQPRLLPPLPPNDANPPDSQQHPRRRSLRSSSHDTAPQPSSDTSTPRPSASNSIAVDISPFTPQSPQRHPSPSSSFSAPPRDQAIRPLNVPRSNSPSIRRPSPQSPSYVPKTPPPRHSNSKTATSTHSDPIRFPPLFINRPYPHLRPVHSGNYFLNTTASSYIPELSEPLPCFPLPLPDYTTRTSLTTPSDHLRPNYSTAEAISYFVNPDYPFPANPQHFDPPIPPQQLIKPLTLTTLQITSHPLYPSLALLPPILSQSTLPSIFPPPPSNFLFLSPPPQRHYLEYALYSHLVETVYTHSSTHRYDELLDTQLLSTLTPPYPYHIPLLYSLDRRCGPLPFAFYLTPLAISHLIYTVPRSHRNAKNPLVAHYTRLYILPLRFLCDLYTFLLDPILVLAHLFDIYPAIPYITYPDFCTLCPTPFAPPLPPILVTLNQLVSSLPLPQTTFPSDTQTFQQFRAKLTYVPAPPLPFTGHSPVSTMANPSNPNTTLHHTANLYDSSRSNPLDPPTRLSEPNTHNPSSSSSSNQFDIDQIYDAPPTVNFTKDDVDNFCRANPYNLSKTQVDTFVAQLDALFAHAIHRPDALAEGRALRSLQLNLHHTTLAAQVQNFLNPNANLPYPKHLYWRHVAQQYIQDCNHPPPQRHNLASAIHEMTQFMVRQNQQLHTRPRPSPYNQSFQRPLAYRPASPYAPRRPMYRPAFQHPNYRRPFRPQFSLPRPPYANRPALPPSYPQQGHTPIQQANIHFARNPSRPPPRSPSRPGRPFQSARRPSTNTSQVHAITNEDNNSDPPTEYVEQDALDDAQDSNTTYMAAFPDTSTTVTAQYTNAIYYTDDSYDPSQYIEYDDSYTEDPEQLYFH